METKHNAAQKQAIVASVASLHLLERHLKQPDIPSEGKKTPFCKSTSH